MITHQTQVIDDLNLRTPMEERRVLVVRHSTHIRQDEGPKTGLTDEYDRDHYLRGNRVGDNDAFKRSDT